MCRFFLALRIVQSWNAFLFWVRGLSSSSSTYPPPQLLQRQEQEGSGCDSIAETLAALWDAWYPRFNYAEHLLPQIRFVRFTLGDLTSAAETLRRCIHCKMQVQFLPSQELKHHRTAHLFLPKVMRSTVIRNGKRQCASGWLSPL